MKDVANEPSQRREPPSLYNNFRPNPPSFFWLLLSLTFPPFWRRAYIARKNNEDSSSNSTSRDNEEVNVPLPKTKTLKQAV